MDKILAKIACPLCGGELSREGTSLICTATGKRHTYDVARSGYVNLLPPGKGRNARTGDDTEMVRARRSFLEKGHYRTLSETAAALVAEYSPRDGREISFADAGCGEGYHTTVMADAVRRLTGASVVCCGFDASKNASDRASRLAYSMGMAPKGGIGEEHGGEIRCAFMTGNIFSLPLRDSSVGAVVSMFAPIAWEENRRVLSDGGVIVVAASGRDHLLEMRQIIYDEVRLKDAESAPEAAEGFSCVTRKNVKYKTLVESNGTVMDLFGMTPFSYRAPEEGVRRLSERESLEITVDTDFYVFRLEK